MTEESNSSIPEKLGKYIIKSVLGKGSMGIVYHAVDPVIKRHIALKTIRKDFLDPEEADEIISRFKREAQAAGRLNHPNIVTLYEYGEDGDIAFLAMEYIQGRELKEIFLNREWFAVENSVKIMMQLLDALDYSHKQGVVHRDIKPGNIIVMSNGRIKVTDFGIARIESSNLTKVGAVMGTPNYMSPEQFAGQAVDGRSDLFSAGVIFYQLLTGERPFGGDSITTIMHKVLHIEPINPSELNVSIPTAFDPEIAKALAKNPDERFQTAAEFARAIRDAYKRGTSESTPKRGKAGQNDATVLMADNRSKAAARARRAGVKNRKSKPFRKLILVLSLLLLIGFIYNAWLVLNNDLPDFIGKKVPVLKEWLSFDRSGGIKNIKPEKMKKQVQPVKKTVSHPRPKVSAAVRPAPKPAVKETSQAKPSPGRGTVENPRIYSREVIPAPDFSQGQPQEKSPPPQATADQQADTPSDSGPDYTKRVVSGGGGSVLREDEW